jgi:hypothetical protein
MLKLGDLAMFKLGELMKGVKGRLSDIRAGISKYNLEESRWKTRSIADNEMQQKYLHPEIDDGRRAGEEQLLSLANELEPGKASHLIFQRTYDANRDLTKLINILHFLLGDIEKKKIKELVEARWPKDAVTSEERERKLKEIRAGRATAEREEEAAIMELETQGVSVDRRPDETPETFLEWDGKSFNKEKFENYHRQSMAKQRAVTEVSEQISANIVEMRSLESLAQRAVHESDREKLNKQIAERQAERAKLMAKREALQQEYEPRLKLYNACDQFLKEKNLARVG